MSNEKPLYLQALDALRRREALFRVLLFTLVTVIFWIGFSIFFTQRKTKVSIDILKHTEPLNPNIDGDALIELFARTHYTDDQLSDFPIYERFVDENNVSQLIIAGTQVTTTETDVVDQTLEEIVQDEGDQGITITESEATNSAILQEATNEATPQ